MFCVVLEHRRKEVLILRYFASDSASELKTYCSSLIKVFELLHNARFNL